MKFEFKLSDLYIFILGVCIGAISVAMIFKIGIFIEK